MSPVSRQYVLTVESGVTPLNEPSPPPPPPRREDALIAAAESGVLVF